MSDEIVTADGHEEALASELAEKLGDPKGIALYRKIAKEYDEAYIRSMLSQVMEVPQERIRASRAALFTWLIHHHADRSKYAESASDSGD